MLLGTACDHLEDCFDVCKSEARMQGNSLAHSKTIKEWFEFMGVDYIKE